MNTFSHRRIGRLLLSHLQSEYGIRLSRRGFLAGTIMPDFRKKYKDRAHIPEKWTGFIAKEIRRLTAKRQSDSAFDAEYSFKLGVICHFYADFFCSAHTRFEYGRTISHVRYELALDRVLRQDLDALACTGLATALPPGQSADDIVDTYTVLHAQYLAAPQSIENDILYTLRICSAMIAQVTRLSLTAAREVPRTQPSVAVPRPARSAV